MILKIKKSDGNIILVNDDDLFSFNYVGDVSSDTELTIGFASACGINFDLIDRNNIFKDISFNSSTVELYNNEMFKIGIFNTTTIKRKNETLSFECLDNMIKFDVKFMGATFPLTIKDFFIALCIQCNIEYVIESIESKPNVLMNIVDGTNYIGKSCRDILKLICEMTGSYAIINNDGKIELRWFDINNIKKELSYEDLLYIERDELPTSITGLRIYINNQVYSIGSPTKPLFLTDDNSLFLDSKGDYELLIENIYNSNLINFSYYGATLKIPTDYNLKLGDVITFEDKNNIKYKVLITNLDFSNSNMTINSAGYNDNNNYEKSSSGSNSSTNQITSNMFNSSNYQFKRLTDSKDENLNAFNIENVNEKSKAMLFYNGSLYYKKNSSIFKDESNLRLGLNKIKVLITLILNDITLYTYTFNITEEGYNNINFSKMLPLDYKSPVNQILIIGKVISTDLSDEAYFYVGNSNIDIITIGCSADTAIRVNEIRLNSSFLFPYSWNDEINKHFTNEMFKILSIDDRNPIIQE